MIPAQKLHLFYRLRRLLPVYRCMICHHVRFGFGDVAVDVGHPIAKWGLICDDREAWDSGNLVFRGCSEYVTHFSWRA